VVLVLSPQGTDGTHGVPVVGVGVCGLPDGHLMLYEEVVLRRGALLLRGVISVAIGRGDVLATLGATALLGSIIGIAIGIGRGDVLATLGATALLGSIIGIGLHADLVIGVDVPSVSLIRRLVNVGEGIGTILTEPVLLDEVRVGEEPAHLVALLEGVDVVVEVAHLTIAEGVFGDGLTEFTSGQRLVARTTEGRVLVVGGVLESIAVALGGEAVVVLVGVFGERSSEAVFAGPNRDASTTAPRGGGHYMS